MFRNAIRLTTGFLAIVALAGCNRGQPQRPSMTPEVSVIEVRPQKVVLTSELPGRTAGFLVAEIRPQVNGLIQKRFFTEGSYVKANDLLYQIDPAPYQAVLDNAKANLAASHKAADRARAELTANIAGLQRHRATLALAKVNLERREKLIKAHATSIEERDRAVAEVDVSEAGLRTAEAQGESSKQAVGAADAAVKQAEAALETAKINLGYTRIVAPIDGRIGRSNVTEGAIVTAYQPAALATIQKFDPIYVDVPQSTAELNRLRRSLKSGNLKDAGTDRVKVLFDDGTVYAHEGSLKFRDISVDPTTGSVIVRIVVPNPDQILLPGMFVRAVVEEGTNDQAIMLPQQAVLRDPKGNPYVYVVGKDGKSMPRPLTTERAIGDHWLVSSGIAPGEQIVVEGIQKLQMMPPGIVVKASPFQSKKPLAATTESTAQATTSPQQH